MPLARPLPRVARRVSLAALLLAGAGLAGVARPATAQSDEATLAAYRLDEATLNKVAAVTRRAMALSQTPAARAELKAAEAREQSDDADESIAGVAARLERLPFLKQALAESHTTAREFVTFQLSLLQAGMAEALVAQYGDKARLPAGVPKANVDFVRTHKAQLEALGAEMKRLEAATDAAADDDPPPAG